MDNKLMVKICQELGFYSLPLILPFIPSRQFSARIIRFIAWILTLTESRERRFL
jgi:hypothetical protein